jgi:hypothetical protein
VLGAATLAVVLVAAWFGSSPPPAPIDRAVSPPSSRGSLFELPTRGSLGGDDSWLAGLPDLRALAGLPAERHVAFAGDLWEERVALVLGDGPEGPVAAWLTGRVGASPQGMSLAAPPASAAPSGPIALWDTPTAAWLGGVLVVVTMPGDAVRFVPGVHVDATGVARDLHRELTGLDGVATASVRAPVATDGVGPPAGRVVVTRSGSAVTVVPMLSDRALELADSPIEPADPRGLRAEVDEQQLQAVLRRMVGTYGLRPRQVSPILLAAGRADSSSAVLVGATMPSGATVAWLSVSRGDAEPRVGPLSTTPEAAGAALIDRVVAVWTAPPTVDGLRAAVVSGPRKGTVAEALATNGGTLGRSRLIHGAGVAALPAESVSIRVRDADGDVLAEGPIARPAE